MIALFWFFLQMGFVSFGGGYALIPLIERETERQAWMSNDMLVDAIAVAGMSPGPIAVNLGMLVGYQTYGATGAIASVLGLLLPSMLMTAGLIYFITRDHKNYLKRCMYGVQPVVTALIFFAAYQLCRVHLSTSSPASELLPALLIVGTCLFMLLRLRMHPFAILLFSGICGAAFYA
ncbi:chromate transporter [Paenibacillus sp. FSL H8-0548]|uniref:chromate transporter n=1 Tax=Paenibacillus sp. FSL H8-0548 TaxID=1920422 RepID=UPI0009F8CA77|nr:chromate transporter [Paenibacillus sp. FSL H8-0548]